MPSPLVKQDRTVRAAEVPFLLLAFRLFLLKLHQSVGALMRCEGSKPERQNAWHDPLGYIASDLGHGGSGRTFRSKSNENVGRFADAIRGAADPLNQCAWSRAGAPVRTLLCWATIARGYVALQPPRTSPFERKLLPPQGRSDRRPSWATRIGSRLLQQEGAVDRDCVRLAVSPRLSRFS
jgi:hypothetical protein